MEHMYNLMRASDMGMFPYDLTVSVVDCIHSASHAVHRASAIEWIMKVIYSIIFFETIQVHLII